MKNIILFDSDERSHLLPLTYTRPMGELIVGALSISRKWELHLSGKVSYITQDYLSSKFPIKFSDDNYLIHGGLLPNIDLIQSILRLEPNQVILCKDELIAGRLDQRNIDRLINDGDLNEISSYQIENSGFKRISRLWDIISNNGQQIIQDIELITKNKYSYQLSPTNIIIGNPELLFAESGVKAEYACFNTSDGPIYLGKDSEIMEGSMIRGPFAIGNNSIVKMGAKIYPNVSVGEYAKAGGEIGNSIISSYSNKGHDGYLGDSIIGEWCNLGADTNTSNLKNNYAEVKLWDYASNRFESTGMQFCGLIMGDHSKCGINTMFNTGTVVGVSCNIFGDGYPRNFIPSFSWGGANGLISFSIEKAFEASNAMMMRRSKSLTEEDKEIFIHILDADKAWRKS
ncbi:MAG TPA: putative sugar nucleotidyl transferase [Saprospiraceae bacterium]|nr:putative sugar nucleotidyl transferase [Saprospiraceae bacterium]